MLKRLFLPVALLLVMAGCTAKEYEWIVKIEEKPIEPKAFVAAQMHAFVQAQPMADNVDDIMGGTVDGQSGARWVEGHTIDKLKRDYFINSEFEKRNLKFAPQAKDFIKIFAEEGWENVEKMYKNNGLAMEDYITYLEGLYKEQLVFNDVFLNGEDNPVTDREIEDYLRNNLCRVALFKIARINDDGSAADRQQIQALDGIVADAVTRINDGENMADVASQALGRSGVLLGSSEDFSNGADFVTTAYISNSNINLVYDFMADFFTFSEGQCVSYTLDDCYYICQKIPLCDTQVEYMYMKQDVANIIRDVEFENMIQRACENIKVEYNSEAVSAFSPEKIRIIIE